MSEMVERIARTLDEFDLDAANPRYEQELDRAIRAILAAMREPTEAMLRMGCSQCVSPTETFVMWQAMIDEVMK